jgi:hypothetical protein
LKFLLLINFFITALSLSAAEFTLNGTIIHSKTVTKEITCNGYSIRLITEKFPLKYEMHIPKKFTIKHFYGSDTILKEEAYLLPGNLKIPTPNELHGIKNTLPPRRIFLPYKAFCKKNTFVIFYTSGGNCHACETFVKFEVINGKPSNPVKINYATVKEEGSTQTIPH